jgi:hypothetical protein
MNEGQEAEQPAAEPQAQQPVETPAPAPEAPTLPELTPEEKADAELVARVDDIVSYHKPDQAGLDAINNVRYFTKQLIVAIVKNCPASPDRSAAIRKAREAMMTANASIVVPGARLPL